MSTITDFCSPQSVISAICIIACAHVQKQQYLYPGDAFCSRSTTQREKVWHVAAIKPYIQITVVVVVFGFLGLLIYIIEKFVRFNQNLSDLTLKIYNLCFYGPVMAFCMLHCFFFVGFFFVTDPHFWCWFLFIYPDRQTQYFPNFLSP